jgi:protein kinase C substrate 80K-H
MVRLTTSKVYKFEEYLPKPLRDWIDQKLRDLRVFMVDNGILAGAPSDGAESKEVTDARLRLNDAENELSAKKNDLTQHKEDLEKDYGPSEIFRAVKGRCIGVDSGEYTYEFCFMDKTTQKSRKGGGDTNMGNYVRLEKVMVDEELPADGKGLGSGERYAMKFENGQGCWNGPNRSTFVILACSENDELWKVSEEEKCVYRMEVGTPVVCESSSGSAGSVKDEL